MAEEISWDDYNAHQAGRDPRPLLLSALRLRPDTGPSQDATGSAPVAVDLGCGEGVEVGALLAAGWTVHAVDGEAAALGRLTERTDEATRSRLHLQHRTFAEAEVPPADLVHSSYALPYCAPEHFDRLWRQIRASLRPGGLLALQLFGVRDSMAGTPEMTFHTVEEVHELLDGLEVLHWREEDAPGTSFTGPKHWHVFHVIARQPTG